MNEKILIKKKLIDECKRILQEEVYHTKKAMDEAQEEANSHKGAMESRYDTFKEEAQYKAGAYAKKLIQLNQQLTQLNLMKLELHNEVKLGSIIITPEKKYFVIGYLSAEPINIDGESFNLISLSSPLGQKLFNKKAGDVVFLNNKEIKIEQIF